MSVLTTRLPCCKTYMIVTFSVDSGMVPGNLLSCSPGITELIRALNVSVRALDKIGRSPSDVWSNLSNLAHVERHKLLLIILVT